MKNRAKCKLCSSVIESFHSTDWIVCKCEEIAVGGGDALQCAARNWNNFLRIDDEGNEIEVKTSFAETGGHGNNHDNQNQKNKNEATNDTSHVFTRDELMNMLSEMIKNIDNLPPHVMSAPITHYDFSSLMILLLALFRDDSCNNEI